MDEEILEKYRKAGKIAAQALELGKKLIKEDVLLLEVTDKIEEKILELCAKPAFPVQISLNHIAAHYCAKHNDDTRLKQGDLAKLDIGVHIDGYVGDNACTVDLGTNKKLVEASLTALNKAISIVKPGITVAEIGKVINKACSDLGFVSIKNLTGHGLSRYCIHDAPAIPNFDTKEKIELVKGQVIAIEPFATNGQGYVIEGHDAEIFSLAQKKPVRSMATRLVLKEIEKFNGLPFTTRWLTKKFPLFKVNFAMKEMDQLGMLKLYPPLYDKGKGLVSQAEHTILVDDPPEVLTRF